MSEPRTPNADVVEVETPHGPGRLTIAEPAGGSVRAVLALGHGAGGGIEAVDLVTLARLLPERGIAVARYEQPWRVAGKRVAARPAILDAGWLPAMAVLAERFPGVPSVTGGRSAGARVACRTASQVGAAGVLCLAFPLHPPGKPESSRLGELVEAGVPVLVVQGTRDPFGTTADVREAIGERADIEVIEVDAAGHDLKKPARAAVGTAETWRDLSGRIADFVLALT